MSNRLASESSLYLRQHADQPVHWWPWGPEALAEARRRDVPVIVSIGYSACHWCHVMARESFDSAFIAQLMNEHFVCIKVDREERPDVDRVYMETIQMLNGHGGWPLNAFCLPDGRPFAGGTYFPPDDRRSPGIVPWPVLLMRVSEHFKRNRRDLEENAAGILENLAASNAPLAPRTPGAPLQNTQLLDAARALCAQHDDEHGGFGSAPKFPPHGTLDFLLLVRAARAVDQDGELSARLDTVLHRTLTAMAHGGIYDQVGGGFARYAVDRIWLIPHFEKMLYDNGQLLSAYALAWRRSGKPLYRAVAEETAAWLEREMALPGGVYAAALDADTDHHEGLTYVWTPAQVREILGEADGSLFCAAYCITDEGTFEEGTSQAALGEPDFGERQKLAPIREKLLAARNLRPQPGRDTKVLTAWNALAIKGLADCGWAFGDKTLLLLAATAADWIWQNHRDANGRLLSVSHGGKASQPAFLDDHAFLADAALALAATADWLEPGLGKLWQERARSLADDVLKHFADPEGQPGFYFTADDAETPVSRRKEWFDNAIPAGNSVLVRVFASLYALTGDNTYADPLASLRAAYPGLAERVPGGVPTALAGFAAQALGIAVVKVKGISDLEPLRAALTARPPRPVFVQLTDDPAQPAGYQLCVGTQCLAPATDPAEVSSRL